MGVIFPRHEKLVDLTVSKLQNIVSVIFLPLYFTFSGLRTDLRLLNDFQSWGVALLIFVVAFSAKVFGCSITSKYFLNTTLISDCIS